MTASGHYGFLQRWSRRKEQARESHPCGDAALPDAPGTDVPGTDAPGADAPGAGSSAAGPAAVPRGAAPPEQPALTLDDVRALTPESDFAPFVARQVAPDVKNAALKKLFSDPRYNVMDGLDTYIDDYSNMEALPASMLARLASARALAMFDPADDTAGQPPLPGQEAAPPCGEHASPDALPVADASATPDVDIHPDLRPGPDPDPPSASPGCVPAQRQG